MNAPIVAVQTVELTPGFKVKHTFDIDLYQTQYADLVAKLKTDLINFINEDGSYGNLDEGEYQIRFKPLEVEVVVK